MYDKMFKKLDVAANVSNGVCNVCHHESMFVSLTPEIYRCVTCGADSIGILIVPSVRS